MSLMWNAVRSVLRPVSFLHAIIRQFAACHELHLCERVMERELVHVIVNQYFGTQRNNFETPCTLVCNIGRTGSAYYHHFVHAVGSVRHELWPWDVLYLRNRGLGTELSSLAPILWPSYRRVLSYISVTLVCLQLGLSFSRMSELMSYRTTCAFASMGLSHLYPDHIYIYTDRATAACRRI
jgi:hypothetical protein